MAKQKTNKTSGPVPAPAIPESIVVTDIEIIKKDPDFKKSVTAMAKIEKKVDAIAIVDAKSQADAGEIRVNLKSLYKEIENKRREFVNPLNGVVKKLNAEFKPKLAAIEGVVQKLDRKILDYTAEQERIAEAARIKAEKANQKRLEKYQEKVEAGKDVAPPTLKPTPEAPKNGFDTKSGSVNMTTIVNWEIEDEAAIPREYFVLDRVKIGKVIRAGGSIAGIKRIEEKRIASRA